jgi:hypothetical protein
VRSERTEARDGRGERPEGQPRAHPERPYSTVTLFAKFLGLSTSQPRSTATW